MNQINIQSLSSKIRQRLEDDDEKKNKTATTSSSPVTDSLRQVTDQYKYKAPEPVKRTEQKPQEEINYTPRPAESTGSVQLNQSRVPEAQPEKSTGRKIKEAFLDDALYQVPSKIEEGFALPWKAANFVGKQLNKIPAYGNFMEDAARGIDQGEGKAAMNILKTAKFSGSIVTSYSEGVTEGLNTETGKKVISTIMDKTSNLGIKVASQGSAFRGDTEKSGSLGEFTLDLLVGVGTGQLARLRGEYDPLYKLAYDSYLKERQDPTNSQFEQVMWSIQDSAPQSLIGVGMSLAATYATKNPKIGIGVAMPYYATLSAGEQLSEEGEVYSLGNIYIDTVGDSVLNALLGGVFKEPAKVWTRLALDSQVEGLTEVLQTFGKFSNDFANAKSDEERDEIKSDLGTYITSGAMFQEYVVGAVTGLIAGGGVEGLNTAGSRANTQSNSKTVTDIKNSLAFPIDAAIEAGDVDAAAVYQNGKDGVLTPEFAKGRIDDVAQKLGKVDPALEQAYRAEMEGQDVTMEDVVNKGLEVLDTNKTDFSDTGEVMSASGKGKEQEAEPEAEPVVKPIELLKKQQAGETLTDVEINNLENAQAAFIDYSKAFQDQTVSVPSIVAGDTAPAVSVQVLPVSGGFSVKYAVNAGETGLNIDYNLNELDSKPSEATERALTAIENWVEEQRRNSNLSPETQSRLEDAVQKIRQPKPERAKPKPKPADKAVATDSAPVVSAADVSKTQFVVDVGVDPTGERQGREITFDTIEEARAFTQEVQEKDGTFLNIEERAVKETPVTQDTQKKTAKTKAKKDTKDDKETSESRKASETPEKKAELEPSRRVTQLVESYAAGEKEVEKLEVLLESINFQDPKEKKKGDDLNKRIAEAERGNKSAVDQLVELTGLPTNVIIDGLSFYISKGETTITDFYNDVNAEVKRIAEEQAEVETEPETKTVANGGIPGTFDTRFDEPETAAEKLAVELLKKSKTETNTDDLTKKLNETLAKEDKGFSFVGSGKDEHIEIFNLSEKQTVEERQEEEEARRVALNVQYHGTQTGKELADAIFGGTVRASEQGILGKGFYVTPTETAAEYFGRQILDGNSRKVNGEEPTVIAIDMQQLNVMVQPFGKQEYYDFLDENNLSPDQYNDQLEKRGYDALYLEGRGETVIFDPAKVRVYNEDGAQATADKLTKEGKVVEAETVKNNAATLTIVPDSLEAQIETYTKEGFTKEIAASRAKDKKRLADGTDVDRPKQLVTKTKLKDLLGGRDRAVFTVLNSGEGSRTTLSDTLYLYEKTDSSETYLRPSALGLIEAGLTVGQEVVLDVTELKVKGTRLNAVNSEGAILAEPVRFTKYKNNVLRQSEIKQTLDQTKTQGYYTTEERTRLFERFILPQLKRMSPLKNDEVIVYYQPANGDSGQYVNQDLARVWWVANIDQNFVVKKVKESELTSTGFEEKDNVGEAIYYPESKIKARKETQPRDSKGRWVSPDDVKEYSEALVETEYSEVSKRVQKAEKDSDKPSRFLRRVPATESKQGDIRLNERELQKGNEIQYKNLIRRQDIGRKLANELGVVVRYGKFRQKATGIYKVKQGVVRLSSKYFRTDRKGGEFTTLVHEIGHYIDYAVHPFRQSIPKEEIKPLLEQYGGGYDSVSQRERRPEALAEFLRYWLTEPETAKKKAPVFYKYFEETLRTGYPEVLKPLEVARNDFQNWLEQPAVSKVASQIDFEGKNRKSRVRDFFTSTSAMFREVVDDIAGIKKFDERSYMLSRNARGWSGRANYFLEHGTVSANFWKKGENGQTYIDKKGKSLKEILKGVEEKSALAELSTYLVAKRSIELTGRGIVSGVDIEDARMTVLFMEKKHPDFIKVSSELDTYQTQLLEYLQESGNISEDSLKVMKELNKSYTPFFRVHEELEGAGQMSSGGNKNPIKRIKGSEFLIVDPIESIIKNTYSLIYAAEQNQPLLAMKKAAESGDIKKSQMFEKVPVDQTLAAKVNPKEVVEKAMGLDDFSKMFLTTEQQEFVDKIPEELVNIFRPAFKQKGNVVTVMVDGKPEYYVAEEELYKAIEGLNREDVALAAQIAAIPAKFLRAGATLSPDFMLRNPLRDTGSAAIISKNNFIPVYSTVRGMASVLKQDKYYQAWLLSGGDMATLVSQDRNEVRKTRDTLLSRNAQIKQYIVNPLQALRLMSNFTEQATRVGEMRGALIRGKDNVEAAYDSRNVSSDFGRHGAATAAISTMSAFFNARVQGFTILAESIKERPLQTMTKGTLYYTIPSILLYLVNRDDPEYWEIPRWQKDLFWLVKLPNGVWLRIPKPFEVGTIFATLPERFIEYVDRKDPRAVDGMFDLLVMNNIPIPTPTLATPIVENLTNYSFFLDRPIVSQSLENLPDEFQYTNQTSEIAKWVGSQTGTSPLKVDNLLNGYFATLGRYTLDTVDKVLEGTGVVASITEPTKQAADLPVVKAFVVRPPSGSQSNSVNLFYKEREKATKAYNAYKLLLEEGKTEKAREYFVEHPEIRLRDTYNDIARDVSEIRKARDAVYESETLSPEKKREVIDKLNETMTTVTYRAINIELE